MTGIDGLLLASALSHHLLVAGEDSAVAHGQVLTKERTAPGSGDYPNTPPARVSSDPNHRDYHPSCSRIGVLVDGERRKDCCWYDAPGGFWRSIDDGRHGTPRPGAVTVFWLWQESRQERRARERWDSKHGHG